MLGITVLFLFIASGFANFTSSEFQSYLAREFGNHENSEFANFRASDFANHTRPPKLYFGLKDIKHYFYKFIHMHGKMYNTESEMIHRYRIFKDNLMKANHLNEKYPVTNFGITEFSDMTPEEFNQKLSGLGGLKNSCQMGYVSDFIGNTGYYYSFDWRYYGVVTPVKNQGNCNSCYAWSIIGNLESQYARRTGRLLNLSAQQIIDCDYTSQGCTKGWTSNAGLYLYNYGGAMSESAYPPTKERGPCRYDPYKISAPVSGCYQYPYLDEESLKQLLVSVGPISVAVDSRNFYMYTGGIFYNCGKKINHAVLLVGYGEENGYPYWTIKNSYGSKWGEQGYIRILRGQNTCGIVNDQILSVFVQ